MTALIIQREAQLSHQCEGGGIRPGAGSHWDRAGFQATVARASGLEVWCSFCGWLTGQPLEVEEVKRGGSFS